MNRQDCKEWTGWRDDGACLDAPPEDHARFFGEDPDLPAQTQHRIIREQYCYKCDVQVECLMYAAANELKFGVWGGLTESHRRRKLKQAIRRDGFEVPVFVRVIEEMRPKPRR